MEKGNRSTIWDSKEPASYSLHCFHEGLQIQVYLFHDPIQKAIDYLLLPTLFGQTEPPPPPPPRDLRQLVTLTPAQVPWAGDLRFEAPQQFAASTSITASHVDLITTQYVHGERREFQGGVKKTTSRLENCVDEIENWKYGLHSTLGSAAVS